jgi:hypothetical protein
LRRAGRESNGLGRDRFTEERRRVAPYSGRMPCAYDARDAYGRLRPAASQSGRPARGLVHDTTCCAISAARLAITRSVLQTVDTRHRRSRRVASRSSASAWQSVWLIGAAASVADPLAAGFHDQALALAGRDVEDARGSISQRGVPALEIASLVSIWSGNLAATERSVTALPTTRHITRGRLAPARCYDGVRILTRGEMDDTLERTPHCTRMKSVRSASPLSPVTLGTLAEG